MAYNDYKPYTDLQNILNAKIGWNNATTDEERKRQNEIANAARKNLEAYGYKNLADQVSAEGADATATRKIVEANAPKPTYSDKELINKNNNEVNQKVNQLWGTQGTDKEMMVGKYGKLEDTAYSNPFETEEGKAIMGKYDLKAMQGRENEVASGSASNGGNIDSFAAANALRQQAVLTAQGQDAVLNAHNNKINNVKGILADLGVYLQNQDKGMQTTIGIQQEEGQRLFEDNLAENKTMAEVTGYVPNEWTIKNDAVYSQFLNADGTFKKEMENVDIQALINQTTDAETKKKLAVVRAKKMLGNYEAYGKHWNEGDVAFMENGQITEQRRQSEQDDATVRESLKTESADTRYVADAEKEASKYVADKSASESAQKNATDIAVAQIKAGGGVVDENGNVVSASVGSNSEEWENFTSYFSNNDNMVRFLNEQLKPYYDQGREINEEVLENLIVGADVLNSNSTIYDIDTEHARLLCNALGLDASWVNKYTNRTGFNNGKGMKLAK